MDIIKTLSVVFSINIVLNQNSIFESTLDRCDDNHVVGCVLFEYCMSLKKKRMSADFVHVWNLFGLIKKNNYTSLIHRRITRVLQS